MIVYLLNLHNYFYCIVPDTVYFKAVRLVAMSMVEFSEGADYGLGFLILQKAIFYVNLFFSKDTSLFLNNVHYILGPGFRCDVIKR